MEGVGLAKNASREDMVRAVGTRSRPVMVLANAVTFARKVQIASLKTTVALTFQRVPHFLTLVHTIAHLDHHPRRESLTHLRIRLRISSLSAAPKQMPTVLLISSMIALRTSDIMQFHVL